MPLAEPGRRSPLTNRMVKKTYRIVAVTYTTWDNGHNRSLRIFITLIPYRITGQSPGTSLTSQQTCIVFVFDDWYFIVSFIDQLGDKWIDRCFGSGERQLADYVKQRMHWFTANTWWRHQIETFSELLAICAGHSLVTGEFPAQRPVTRSFDVFFDLRLNQRLGKQWRGWWFETRSRPLWRLCYE